MIWKLALAAAIASATGGVARAEPVLEMFQKFCFDHRGARTSALATADALGWTPTAKADVSNVPAGTGSGELEGRTKKDGAVQLYLVVGRQRRELWGHDTPTDLCAVGVTPADREALEAAVAKFAGVSPTPGADHADFFIWRTAGTKHLPVALADEGTIAPDVSVLLVGGNSQGAMVGMIVPREVSPN
jgi:hypothetical protein